MDEKQEMLELLRSIERTNRQNRTAGILICVCLLIAAAGCVTMCVLVLNLMPQVNEILNQVDIVLANLEETTSQLKNLNLEAAVSDMDALVVYAQDSLRQTMEKLNTLDLETLNKAIQDLSRVIEPLAKFAALFG